MGSKVLVLLCCLLFFQYAYAAEEGKDGWPCSSNDECISECKDNQTKLIRLCNPVVDPVTSLSKGGECISFEYPCDWLGGEVCVETKEGPKCEAGTETKVQNDNLCPGGTYQANISTKTSGQWTTTETGGGSGDCKESNVHHTTIKKDATVSTTWINEYHCVNPGGMDATDDSSLTMFTRHIKMFTGEPPTYSESDWTPMNHPNKCYKFNSVVVYYCSINSGPPASKIIKCDDLKTNPDEIWGCIYPNDSKRSVTCGKRGMKETCSITDVKGVFQPAQGVWQDDLNFPSNFVKNSDTSYRANIPMVVDRPSLLYGARTLSGGEGYEKIVIEGKSSYSQSLPVFVRFTLKQPGSEEVIYNSNNFNIPIEGSCGATQNFTIEMPTATGVPAKPFNFTKEGPYILEAEVIRADNNESTNIIIRVFGDTKNTSAPLVRFEYLVINETTPGWLERDAKKVMAGSNISIAEYYPLPLDGFRVQWGGLRNLSIYKSLNQSNMRAAIESHMTTTAIMSGVDRVVAVVSSKDLGLFYPSTNAVAYTANQKTMFMTPFQDHTTVAHELVHTMPYLWSSTDMIDECSLNYHNKNSTIANGQRLIGTTGAILSGEHHYMGSAGFPFYWTDQCTYRHLIDVLVAPPDPEVLYVHGTVSRDGKTGELGTLYQLNSTIDPVVDGNWSLIVKVQGGNIAANYTFNPVFQDPNMDDVIRENTGFFMRLPYRTDITTLELHGPAGMLDSKSFNTGPSVTIQMPASGSTVQGNTTLVKWEGEDLDNDELLYTVFYSNDGQFWTDYAFESNITSINIQLSNATNATHFVKVIVTDGTQSAEDVVRFNSTVVSEEPPLIVEDDVCASGLFFVLLFLCAAIRIEGY